MLHYLSAVKGSHYGPEKVRICTRQEISCLFFNAYVSGAIALSRTLAEQKDNVVHCFLEPYAVERLCRTEKLNDRPHQTLLDHMLYHIASFKCIRSVYTIDYLSGAEFRLESVAFEGLVEDKPDELLYYNLATLVATLSTENTSQIHSTIALIDAAVKKCFDYNPTDPCVTKKEAWLAFFGTAETMKAYPSLRTPVVFEAPAVDWHATFLNDATLSTVAVAPTI